MSAPTRSTHCLPHASPTRRSSDLAAAVTRAQQRGILIVAAVGNNGPAAPHAYPASYRGVLAVTCVDAKDRLLPEAGRALHVDFAAPGDDVLAATDRKSTRLNSSH